MPDNTPDNTQVKKLGVQNRRVHLANERTFLAWIRTSVAIMAFGFVVEKFALFINQVQELLRKTTQQPMSHPSAYEGYSSIFGVALVALGALMGFISFIRYKKVERQIDEDTYQPSFLLNVLLAITVLTIGIFLVIYLIHSM